MRKIEDSTSKGLLLELAYESACESLSQQRSDLRSVRSQASIIAAVSGLTGTLFSRLVFEVASGAETKLFYPEGAIWGMPLSIALAVLAFVVSVLFSLRILMPSSGWLFEDSPTTMINKLEKRGGGFDDNELRKLLAISKERRFDKNEELMKDAQSNLFFAAAAAFAQIPFWIFSIVNL